MNPFQYNLSIPDIKGRRAVLPYELHRGSIVAFAMREYDTERTGIIVMDSPRYMKMAYNMYGDVGGMWVEQDLPQEDIWLFEANEEETLWGLRYFMWAEYGGTESLKGRSPFIDFILEESPKKEEDEVGKWHFCQSMLARVPDLVDGSMWKELKNSLTTLFVQSGGLQFNQFRAECYAYLIGVLMIAECESDPDRRKQKIALLNKKWGHFSWMYGMALGRVLGCRLHNFTAVINQAANTRKKYLHLYLPLAERYADKMLIYNDDKTETLHAAINKARKVEAQVEQNTDLDDLYRILFPRVFRDAMSSARPAATIAELKQEVNEKDRKIRELEKALSESIPEFNTRYETLLHNFEDLAAASVSFDEIENGLCNLSRAMAEAVVGHLSVTLAANKRFTDQIPRFLQAIGDKDKTGTEIHNHFEAGSNCQVFNGPTTGEFKK